MMYEVVYDDEFDYNYNNDHREMYTRGQEEEVKSLRVTYTV